RGWHRRGEGVGGGLGGGGGGWGGGGGGGGADGGARDALLRAAGRRRPPAAGARGGRHGEDRGRGPPVRRSGPGPRPRRRRDPSRRRRDGAGVGARRRERRPALTYHTEQWDAALHGGRDPLADRRFRLVAVGREHDQPVRNRRQPGQGAGGEIQQQQGVFRAEAAVQLSPAGIGEQVARMSGDRTGRDEKDAVHLVRRLGEGHVVFERVHDALGGADADPRVQRRPAEPPLPERDAPVAMGRGARHVPRRLGGPRVVPGRRDQGHERLTGRERRHEGVEPRARQGTTAP